MMVVIDKQKDIAILRTYGLEPKRVARIFLVQGSMIGLLGTVLGTSLGLVLALNVDVIVPWLETTFNFQIMPGDVYYVTRYRPRCMVRRRCDSGCRVPRGCARDGVSVAAGRRRRSRRRAALRLA